MTQKALIVGAGVAGSRLHLEAYRRLPDVEVVAICDRDGDRASKVAQEKRIPRVYQEVEDALDEARPDIVSVCTPPATHFDIASLALERGASVLVEKPIFETMDEADRIQEIARRTGGKLSAVHNQKYLPGVAASRRIFSEGRIGDRIHEIHSVWMVDGTQDRMIMDPNFWCHALPGGRWQEMIAHPIYKAYAFSGPMELLDVRCRTAVGRWPWLPADEVVVTLGMEHGFHTIQLSANVQKYNYMLLYGNKRVLYVDSASAVEILEAIRPRTAILAMWKAATQRLTTRIRHINTHAVLIREFVEYTAGERPTPPVSWEEAYNTFRLALDIGHEIRRQTSGHS